MAWNALKHGLAALAAGTIQNHTALQARVAEEAKTARLQEAKAAYEAGLKAEERQFELDKMGMQEGMRTERETAKAETTAAAAARAAEEGREFTSKENELNRLSREKAAMIRASNSGKKDAEEKPQKLEKLPLDENDESGNITWIDASTKVPVKTTNSRGQVIAKYDEDGELIDPNADASGEQIVRGIDDVPGARPTPPKSEAKTEKPKPYVPPRQVMNDQEVEAAMKKANELIAAGADRNAVLARLRALGIELKEK